MYIFENNKVKDNNNLKSVQESFRRQFGDNLITVINDCEEILKTQLGLAGKIKQMINRKIAVSLVATVGNTGTETAVNAANVTSANTADNAGKFMGALVRVSAFFYFRIKDKKQEEKIKEAKQFLDRIKLLGGSQKLIDNIVAYLFSRFIEAFELIANTQTRDEDIKSLSEFFATVLVYILMEEKLSESTLSVALKEKNKFSIQAFFARFFSNELTPEEEAKQQQLLLHIYEHIVPKENHVLYQQDFALNQYSFHFREKLKFCFPGANAWTIEGLLLRSPCITPQGHYMLKNNTHNAKYPPQRLNYEVAIPFTYSEARLVLPHRSSRSARQTITPVEPIIQPNQNIFNNLTAEHHALMETLPLEIQYELCELKAEDFEKLDIHLKELLNNNSYHFEDFKEDKILPSLWQARANFYEAICQQRAKINASSEDMLICITPLMNYIKKLLQYYKHRYLNQNVISDTIEMVNLRQEVRWIGENLTILLMHAQTLKKPNENSQKTRDLFHYLRELARYSLYRTYNYLKLEEKITANPQEMLILQSDLMERMNDYINQLAKEQKKSLRNEVLAAREYADFEIDALIKYYLLQRNNRALVPNSTDVALVRVITDLIYPVSSNDNNDKWDFVLAEKIKEDRQYRLDCLNNKQVVHLGLLIPIYANKEWFAVYVRYSEITDEPATIYYLHSFAQALPEEISKLSISCGARAFSYQIINLPKDTLNAQGGKQIIESTQAGPWLIEQIRAILLNGYLLQGEIDFTTIRQIQQNILSTLAKQDLNLRDKLEKVRAEYEQLEVGLFHYQKILRDEYKANLKYVINELLSMIKQVRINSNDSLRAEFGKQISELQEELDEQLKKLFFAAIAASDLVNLRQIIFYATANNLNWNTPSEKGFTALHEAAVYGDEQVFNYFLNKALEEKVKIKEIIADWDNATLLHSAAMGGNLAIIKKLINLNIDLNKATSEKANQRTALHVAAVSNQSNKAPIIKSLLDAGADLKLVDNGGCTVLHCLAQSPVIELEAFKLLLLHPQIKNLINQPDLNGRSVLHYLAANPHIQAYVEPFIVLLIQAGAQLNMPDNNGDTPLHLATKNKAISAIQALGRQGANLLLVNKQNFTPLQEYTQRKNAKEQELHRVFTNATEKYKQYRQLQQRIDNLKEELRRELLNNNNSSPPTATTVLKDYANANSGAQPLSPSTKPNAQGNSPQENKNFFGKAKEKVVGIKEKAVGVVENIKELTKKEEQIQIIAVNAQTPQALSYQQALRSLTTLTPLERKSLIENDINHLQKELAALNITPQQLASYESLQRQVEVMNSVIDELAEIERLQTNGIDPAEASNSVFNNSRQRLPQL